MNGLGAQQHVESLDQLCERYRVDRLPETRNRLMMACMPLLQRTARSVHRRLPAQVEFDDLVQMGTLGLMDAIESFDPGRRVKFATYAALRIRGAILDALRAMDWAPRQARADARRLYEAASRLETELGRTPADAELQERLQVPPEHFRRLVAQSNALWERSFSTVYRRETDTMAGDERCMADPRSVDPSQHALREDLREELLRGLSRAERLIVVLYHCEKLTFKEIGRVLDLSVPRVCQIHHAVLNRLRSRMQSREAALVES